MQNHSDFVVMEQVSLNCHYVNPPNINNHSTSRLTMSNEKQQICIRFEHKLKFSAIDGIMFSTPITFQ
jgi:hypothetical protein